MGHLVGKDMYRELAGSGPGCLDKRRISIYALPHGSGDIRIHHDANRRQS